MQSNGVSVSETPALYCQALMTTCITAGGSTKPFAATSGQQHVQHNTTSHLVTSRAKTASQLTKDYVSEVYSDPSGKYGVVTLQTKDIPNIDSTTAEYVQFISRNHVADNSEMAKTATESPVFRRNQSGSRTVTSSENDDVLYSEIKDNDGNEHTSDLILPALPDSCYSTAAWEDIVVERDKLLQRVSRLTIEKQEMVYKLRTFVETNGRLHVELERARAEIVELENKLSENQSLLEQEQHEKALVNARLVELTSLWTLKSNELHVNQEQPPLHINKQTSEEAVVNTGNSLLFI